MNSIIIKFQNFSFKKFFKRLLLFMAGFIVLFIILELIFPLKVNVHYSQIITADDSTVLHAFLTPDQKWRMFTELNEISPELRKTILFKEDQYFYYHFGVNPFAIGRAAFNNLLHNKKTSGASTISMQVIRMLHPKRRTVFNKMVESFRAVQLELKYNKNEILQLYLNLVPYGGNIEGVKSASLLYFGVLPKNLSLAQIVTLSIIPNRPVSLRPGYNNSKLIEERNKWLWRIADNNIFPKKEIEDALNEPLDARRVAAPHLVPHLAYRLKSENPEQAIIHTHINRFKQDKVETIAYNYNKRLRLQNINNAAVIVINNKTRNVEAYLGSPDFNDSDNEGQVDGVEAVRSPGSALKPLVYAIAFDNGLITPKTVITDVPVNYMGYAPENFNSKFNGNVTVETALSNSLNIPAVKTLNKEGLPLFIDKLKQANFSQVKKDEKKLGLSSVLGGCGVTLEELSNLYCTFANDGNYQGLNYTTDDTTKIKTQLISNASAYLVSEILSRLIRPDLPNNYQSSMHVPRIAWKTGTSYGRRDAWSIGYNKKYTVGVWVGNFSGEGVAELSGADKATPLLFEIFNSLDYNSTNEWFHEPEGISFRLVCSESGMVPDEFCENQVMDYFIPEVSSIQKCSHLKQVFISADEKISYCTSCLPPAGYKKKLFPNPEPDLIAFYESKHISYTKIPPHNPQCTRVFRDKPPVITSPENKKTYIVEKKNNDQIMLSCNTDNEVQTVYWYIDDRFYKSAKPTEQLFFIPVAGEIKISCSDDKGRNSNIWIKVSDM